MPLQYQLENNLVRIRAWSVVTERDFVETLSGFAEISKGRALHMPVLTIFSGDTSLSEIDLAALKRIRAHLESLLRIYPGPPVRSAWVTTDSQSSAVVRLWQAFVDLDETLGRRIKVFSNEADALAWLEADTD